MGLPTHFKNPFIEQTRVYRTSEIFKNITLSNLDIVLFRDIALRKPDPKLPNTKIEKRRILGADTRYPCILYQSHLDPLNNGVAQKYCVFDGTHRILKMMSEGKAASTFFIITPKIFEGLQDFAPLTEGRTTGCNACSE